MSMAHLGEQIDIHGGGRDLFFPHHENEIAQAESVTGRAPFCGYWLHNGMLRLDGIKMSKSLGNLVLARNLLREVEADHLRLYLLSTHYRADADYRHGALAALGDRYQRLKAASAGEGRPTPLDPAGPVGRAFAQTMDGDLDTPTALDLLDRTAASVLSGGASAEDRRALRSALSVLGFAFAGAPGPVTGSLSPEALRDR